MVENNSQDKEKKVIGFAIKVRIIGKMHEAGYTDINDYIDALNNQIEKLQNVRIQIQNDLQQANQTIEELEAKLKECENAK